MPSKKKKSTTQMPPPPPPPPPAAPRSKLRIRTAPRKKFFLSAPPQHRDPAPEGIYFFYGSLLDPEMLVEILGLDKSPELRPAYIEGFDSKLWGQYPALIPCSDASPKSDRRIIEGAAYRVRSSEDAEKLAKYESRYYMPSPCEIKYVDHDKKTRGPIAEKGFVFVFVGDRRDLDEGSFDLQTWRRQMRRE